MNSRMASARSNELVRRSDFKWLSDPDVKPVPARLGGNAADRLSNIEVKSTVYLVMVEFQVSVWT